jgi:hypothetical protein
MATYRKVVELIDGWQSLTDAELIEAATSRDLAWADPDKWTLVGVANLIGPGNVSALLAYLAEIGYEWVGTQAAGAGLPIGDEAFNNAMRAIGHPDCIAIADAGRKFISLCESRGLANNGQAVVDAAKAMRLELLRSSKRAEGATRWNSYNRALDTWDGNPNTEPQL